MGVFLSRSAQKWPRNLRIWLARASIFTFFVFFSQISQFSNFLQSRRIFLIFIICFFVFFWILKFQLFWKFRFLRKWPTKMASYALKLHYDPTLNISHNTLKGLTILYVQKKIKKYLRFSQDLGQKSRFLADFGQLPAPLYQKIGKNFFSRISHKLWVTTFFHPSSTHVED